MRRRDFLASGAAFAAASFRSTAFADTEYPQQPIRLIVPRSAGGVVDVVTRLWAEQMQPRLGTFVIEDQGGGGGLIAGGNVAHAKPDGYTLLAGTTSELIISPVIVDRPPYDPVKDLVPITLIAVSVSALMVHASLPVHSLQELITYDKAHPGTLSYGSAGTGTSAQLCAELFKTQAGLPDIVHVPYRGANPGLVDFYAGHLPIFAASISPQVLAMHRNGTIRILVAATDKRLRAAPEIPISAEAGFPDLISVLFIGMFGPAGIPRPIVDKIAAVSHDVMADKAFQEKLIGDGFEPVLDSGPEQTAKFIQEELVRWPPILKAAGIKVD
jgi:tripartite-type tricarboxylate transporter receptor subunit TctC